MCRFGLSDAVNACIDNPIDVVNIKNPWLV